MILVLGLPLAINSISRMINSGAINWHHLTITKLYITAIELTELIKKIPIRAYLNLFATRTTVGNEGIKSVLWNSMAGLVYKGQKSKYKLNLIHIQNGESSAGLF